MSDEIRFQMDTRGVDWEILTRVLMNDGFDNGRTPKQLRLSFERSYVVCFAFAGDRVVGKARVLSDGVCNGYVVDVWTQSAYRHRGIATRMVAMLLEKLPGQHVCLFTDDAMELYQKLGFSEQMTGMSRIVGQWLQNETR